jgi:hypothetical protein
LLYKDPIAIYINEKMNIRYLTLLLLIAISSCKKGDILVINDTGTLPVIRLNTDEEYLWSTDSGLYILPNYLEKWEFPAVIEYLENDQTIFRDNVGFRIKGNASRAHKMKSFGIYWRNEYGKKNLEYRMFHDISTSKFKRLFLRNSGNDFEETHIKDASISMIYKDYANVEYQEYKPCVLYLNNEYWGIYNIREMITPHHFNYHFDVNSDEIDLLEGSELNPKADDGSVNDFLNDIIYFIQENNLSNIDNYTALSNMIDIDSYIDYIIIQTYICNTDWPVGNAKWWRDKSSANYIKWRWVVYDTDLALISDVNKVWIGDLYGNYYNNNKKDGFFIFNNLIKNTVFKKLFLERYLFFIETVFEKSRVESIILSNKARISQEYKNHHLKWNTLDFNQWSKSIDKMIQFNNKRNDIMKDLIKNLQSENN